MIAILEATTQLLEENGVQSLTTNHVAKRAGVSIGTLYQYFPDKQALLDAILSQHLVQSREGITDLIENPPEKLEDAIATLLHDAIASHVDEPRALTEIMTVTGGPSATPTARQFYTEAIHALEDLLTNYEDQLRVSDKSVAAYLLVHTAETAIHAMMRDDPEKLKDGTLERELTDMTIRYLAKHAPICQKS